MKFCFYLGTLKFVEHVNCAIKAETKVILQSPFSASVETFAEIKSKEKNRCLRVLFSVARVIFFLVSLPCIQLKCRLATKEYVIFLLAFSSKR